MKTLPVALVVEGKRMVVVGGGAVAARKVAALLEAGALVTVVSPELNEGFPSPIEHLPRFYAEGDCADFALVFAATNSPAVNSQIAQEARRLSIPVNDASDPDGSDFHTQGVIRRGPISIGISTEGDSPVVSAHLRRRIESLIGPEWEALFALVGELNVPKAYRGAFWKAVLNGPTLELLRDGRSDEAKKGLAALLETLRSAPSLQNDKG